MADHVLPRSGDSLWVRSRSPEPDYAPLDGDADVDVVVVGAGIAGLTAADALSRAGLDVRVIENRLVGSGATGFTTAKISRLQGVIHQDLTRRHGVETATAYALANRHGFEHLLDRLDGLGLGDTVQQRDALSYVVDPSQAGVIAAEVEAATAAGVPVTGEDQPAELGFPVAAAVRLPDQAQFDPVPYLRGLADGVEAAGGRVHEQTRARSVDHVRSRHVVRTECGDLTAEHVLVCTGMPMIDRGLHFARLEAVRSYCVALRLQREVPGALPMSISVDQPSRSLRTAPDPEGAGDLLLVGGEGHTVGREPDTLERYRALLGWAETRFDVAEVVARWSTQDYRSVDQLPFVGGGGFLPPGIAVATGFGKWGMTNGTAAGLALADLVSGVATTWQGVFDAGRSGFARSARSLVALNSEVAWRLVADRVATVAPSHEPVEGEAAVTLLGRRGTSRVDGRCRTVSAVCPHLGGVLSWNPAERSWDCPLHGSRFDRDGAVLQAPAATDLEPHD